MNDQKQVNQKYNDDDDTKRQKRNSILSFLSMFGIPNGI